MRDVALLSDRSVVPLEIGQAVRHRVDPIKGGGVIIGAILKEPVRALVHWRGAPWTFEILEDLAVDDA